jgi:hypothetical protein
VQKGLSCRSSGRFSSTGQRPSHCHALKYLILGCECLLGCVHLSIGFSEIFKDHSAIIIFILELDPFLFGKL